MIVGDTTIEEVSGKEKKKRRAESMAVRNEVTDKKCKSECNALDRGIEPRPPADCCHGGDDKQVS